jgi:hypothetical protein
MFQVGDNSAKKGNKFKALILGLGKRVRLYKQEIAEAKSLDSKKDHVPLMEQLDLRKLQVEKRPGTPEGNMSILTALTWKNHRLLSPPQINSSVSPSVRPSVCESIRLSVCESVCCLYMPAD